MEELNKFLKKLIIWAFRIAPTVILFVWGSFFVEHEMPVLGHFLELLGTIWAFRLFLKHFK